MCQNVHVKKLVFSKNAHVSERTKRKKRRRKEEVNKTFLRWRGGAGSQWLVSG